jgi:U4/U6.U5 tri-snRNP-associated protein 3
VSKGNVDSSKTKTNGASKPKDVNMTDMDEDDALKLMMGFSGFKSTKNTKVPGNEKNYAVRKVKKTEYRQYMNRAGGFNRPLSPS